MSDDTRPAVERMKPPEGLWKFVVNPIMRGVLRSPLHGLVDDRLMLLTYRGRRTGETYHVPVGRREVDGQMTVLTNAGWRVNFRGGHPLTARVRDEVVVGTGTLVEDPDAVASVYADLIDQVGWQKAGRELGIRITVDRAPTHAELREAVEANGLSLLHVELGADDA